MPKQPIKIKEVIDGLDGAPPWITTFVDMISLLVTFFILLYTFSSIREFDVFTYPKNIVSTSGMFEGPSADSMTAPDNDLMLAMDLARGSRNRHTRPVNELLENMEDMGQRLTEQHIPIDLRNIADGIRLKFPESAGYRPGDARSNIDLERALLELADTVQFYPIMIVVEGHTDDAFRPSPTYPDAYAMSIARARGAARILTESGGFDPSLVMLEAHGPERPLSDGATSARDRARNRRVEVRLVSMSKDRMAAESQR